MFWLQVVPVVSVEIVNVSVANKVISSMYEHPDASWIATLYVPVDKLVNNWDDWDVAMLEVFPLGYINVYKYGEVPPAKDTKIEPSLLEHVEPWLEITTDATPNGVNNVTPVFKVQNAQSVTKKL